MQTKPIPLVTPAAPQAGPMVADKLEQAFLEEMLKYAGPKPADDSFGGGIGEEQFSTFLTREYAAILAGALDFGFVVPRTEG